jgi:integrase/recombinase XerD
MGSAGDIGLFLDMLAVERNASRNTLDAYRRDLTDFADDLSGDLNAATTDDVRAYLAGWKPMAPRPPRRRADCRRSSSIFSFSTLRACVVMIRVSRCAGRKSQSRCRR